MLQQLGHSVFEMRAGPLGKVDVDIRLDTAAARRLV